MRPDPWTERAESIFYRALEFPEAVRDRFVREECSGDTDLEDEVTSLLHSYDQANAPTVSEFKIRAPAPPDFDIGLGEDSGRFGAYRAVRELGRGGMATVYLGARSDGAFERTVALKVLHSSPNEALRNRFQTERQILARLEHPNIARLYESGETRRGELFLAMEYVDGIAINAYCSRERLSLQERLKLFMPICDAVAEAHRHLVIHRDIKPSNILVTAAGVPKLLDFGIAKLLEPDASAAPLTRAGANPMTVSFASPEQLRGRALTTATDVYSLGVLLYLLLTGTLPHTPTLAARLDGLEAGTEPLLPSLQVLSDDKGQAERLPPPADQHKISRFLRGDLDAIVSKALRMEPHERYPSVQAMAEDLQRFMGQEPVLARRGSLGYRISRFIRRHRLSALAAVAVLWLIGGWIWTLNIQKQRIAEEKERAQDVASFLVDMFEVTSPEAAQSQSIDARQLLDLGVQRLETEFGDEPELQATLLDTLGVLQYKLGRFGEASRLIEQGRQLRRNLLGTAHPDYADSLDHLAQVALDRSDWNTAEELAKQSLQIRQNHFDSGAPEVAQSYRLLAAVAGARADLELAEKLQRMVLEIRQEALGEEHREAAAAMGDLGRTLTLRGRLEEAKPLLQRAVDLERRILGDRHPDLADSLDRLAGWYLAASDPETAETLYRQALDIRQGFFPNLHPLNVESLNMIGRCLWARGLSQEAERYHRQAVRFGRELWSTDHLQLARVLNDLGRTLTSVKLDEAAAVLRESFEMSSRLLGPRHPEVLKARHYLATVYRQLGEHGAAETELRQLIEDVEALGDRPERAFPRLEYATLLLTENRPQEAELLVRDALETLHKFFDDQHNYVALAEGLLGRALNAQGAYPEAEVYLLRVFEAIEASPMEADTEFRETIRQTLVDLYTAWGKPEQAARFQPPESQNPQ